MRIYQICKPFIVFLMIAFSCHGYAADLLQVYRQALKSDPTFKAAEATYLAATQLYPQARSFLLPNIQMQAQATYNRFENFSPGVFGFGDFVENFPGEQLAVTFTQPIINFAAFYNLRQAKYQVRSAAATFAAAAQDLITRTAVAYFNVLQAEDDLRFTQAEKEATVKQLDQAEQRFKVGVDAITSVLNARATYDSILAQEVTAKNNVLNAKEQLRQITGVYYDHLAKLKPSFPLIRPNPVSVELWVDAASKQNLTVVASRFTAGGERENIQVQFAGYLPTINAIGSYQRIQVNPGGSLASQDYAQGQVGLQLNMPIYQGGLITANTRQAIYQYENALQELEQTYRAVTVNTRQTYNNILAGISRVKAGRQAVISQQSSYDSTAAALKVGTRTIVDLLVVQQDLYNAQRTLAFDQYNYINQILALKELAGTLTYKDIAIVNSWLYNGNKAILQPYSGRLPSTQSPVKPMLYYPHLYRDPLERVQQKSVCTINCGRPSKFYIKDKFSTAKNKFSYKEKSAALTQTKLALVMHSEKETIGREFPHKTPTKLNATVAKNAIKPVIKRPPKLEFEAS